MFSIRDENSIEGQIIFKVKDKETLDNINWISPGGYYFIDKNKKEYVFDWQDFRGDRDEENCTIKCHLYSLDYEFIADGNEIQEEKFRLDFFKDFDRFTEINLYLYLKVNGEIKEFNLDTLSSSLIKCISF